MTKEIFIDPILKKELDSVKDKVLNRDRDFVLVVDGEEGCGKSVLAMQIGHYLDKSLNLDQITFTSEQFKERLRDSKKNSCVILDEGYNAASSRGALTEVNRSLISVATEMRQQNLFVIIVLPTFFDLDKYFALWRCRALFHVYFNKKGSRGQFVIFPKSYKKYLYLNGKKYYNYSKPKSPYPPCKFRNQFVIDKYEYLQKKSDAFKERPTITTQQRKWIEQRNALIKTLGIDYNVSGREIERKLKKWNCKTLGDREIQRQIQSGVNEENDVLFGFDNATSSVLLKSTQSQ